MVKGPTPLPRAVDFFGGGLGEGWGRWEWWGLVVVTGKLKLFVSNLYLSVSLSSLSPPFLPTAAHEATKITRQEV